MYEVQIESVTVRSHICHRYIRLLMVILMFHVCSGHFGSHLRFATLYANGTHPIYSL